jgi:excinuclease ABC subunit C
LEILTALDMASVPLVGLAKRNEELFLPGREEPVTLPEGSPPLRVLQHVRDEAHRFATSYRASLQTKDIVTSALQDVPGIGPRRAARILKSFASLESLVETPVDIVAKSVGITEDLASTLQRHIKRAIFGDE